LITLSSGRPRRRLPLPDLSLESFSARVRGTGRPIRSLDSTGASDARDEVALSEPHEVLV
jgi:hypothetical protein